jgi:hypothetical protein
MSNEVYTGGRARNDMECHCTWQGCRGIVSRSTFYRHQLNDVLAGHDREKASGRPMPVEDSFDEVYTRMHTYKHTFFMNMYTTIDAFMYTYMRIQNKSAPYYL